MHIVLQLLSQSWSVEPFKHLRLFCRTLEESFTEVLGNGVHMCQNLACG